MSKMSRMATVATMATLVVVVLAGGVASATTLRAASGHAAVESHRGHRHHPSPPAVFGVVASVNGTDAAGMCGTAGSAGAFVVSGPRGTSSTVDVSTTTAFVEQGVSAPTFADVCVGDRTGSIGTVSSGTFTATVVFVAPPPPPEPRFVSGTVTSVNGTDTAGTCGTAGSTGSFVLNALHTTAVTVDVSTTTTFSEHGVTSPTFANVCVGEHVGAVGIVTSGTMTANAVFITSQPTSTSADHQPFFGDPKISSKSSGPKYTDEVTPPAEHKPSSPGGFEPGTSPGWSQHSNHVTNHSSGQSWSRGSGHRSR
jgi:hypothetical protein